MRHKFLRYLAIEWDGAKSLVAQSRTHPERLHWFGGMSYCHRTPDMKILAIYPLPEDYTYEDEDRIEVEFYQTINPAQPGILGKDGWLAPDGRFYPCQYGEHYSVAKALVAKHFETISSTADDVLMQAGWRRLQNGHLAAPVTFKAPPPTQKQIDAIYDLTVHYPDDQNVIRALKIIMRERA